MSSLPPVLMAEAGVADATRGSAPTRAQNQDNVSFRNVPARAKMVAPEWLQAQQQDSKKYEVIYPLHLVNGTYQTKRQEVSVGENNGLMPACVSLLQQFVGQQLSFVLRVYSKYELVPQPRTYQFLFRPYFRWTRRICRYWTSPRVCTNEANNIGI